MVIASNGHTLTQIPHPMQSCSEMTASFSLVSPRTMHSSPLMFTGQSLMHSSPHLSEWQRFSSRPATLWTIAKKSFAAKGSL